MNELMNLNTTAIETPDYHNKQLRNATQKIFKIGAILRRCSFETAFIMAEVDASKCYEDDGFKSVHEWAMQTFGFKKSASYTLLKIGKEYTETIKNAKGAITGYTSNLLPEESEVDFTTTQIEKMLPAGHELAKELVQSEDITPEMSCKEIEKVIKSALKSETDTEADTETDTEADSYSDTDSVEVYVIVHDDDGNTYNIPVSVLNQYKEN